MDAILSIARRIGTESGNAAGKSVAVAALAGTILMGTALAGAAVAASNRKPVKNEPTRRPPEQNAQPQPGKTRPTPGSRLRQFIKNAPLLAIPPVLTFAGYAAGTQLAEPIGNLIQPGNPESGLNSVSMGLAWAASSALACFVAGIFTMARHGKTAQIRNFGNCLASAGAVMFIATLSAGTSSWVASSWLAN